MVVGLISQLLYWCGYPFLLILKLMVRAGLFAVRQASGVLSYVKVLQGLGTVWFLTNEKKVGKFWRASKSLPTPTLQSLKPKKISTPKAPQIVSWGEGVFSYQDIAQDSLALFCANIFFEMQWQGNQVRLSLGQFLYRYRWGVSSVTILLILSLSAGWIWSSLLKDLPAPGRIREIHPIVSTKIYDRHGRLLYKIFKDENRTVVPLSEISPYVIQATLAVEDAQFYEHWGVSFRGTARALLHNMQSEDTLQGGSTITQQLVKNMLLTPERTWERKVRELVLALAVDATYSKDEILQYYLNEVNYGGSVYGIEEASQWFFAKPAKDLSLAESALLAGLPVAPSVNSPFGTQPEKAKVRQEEVLLRMQDVGFITPEQREQAQNQELAFRQDSYEIQAPHFVMFVREQLAKLYGEDMVSQGGLEVYTTLDLDVQASAEAALRHELDRLGSIKVSNGAAMVTNPKSGEILAMVGSKDYFDSQNDGQVNVALRPRQPGSSIKPLTYALAFERGYTPSTQIDDTPVSYTSPGAPAYTPKNYDGRFHGKVALREALASSYNIPAVRLLVEIGVDTLVNRGRAFGITTWDDPRRYGLALTLGSGEVTMYDMAQVYGTFANGGMNVSLNPFLSVKTYDGKQIYSNPCAESVQPCNGKRVLSELAAYFITDVLRDNKARTPAFGARSVLNIPDQEVAVKTGTTNSLRDNWTIGYTEEAVVLTWVGNNDNTPMSAVASGVTGASPIWNSIMKSVLAHTTHRFALPNGFERVKICVPTGTLACGGCPVVSEEVFPPGMAPKKQCESSWFTKPSASPLPNEKTASRR